MCFAVLYFVCDHYLYIFKPFFLFTSLVNFRPLLIKYFEICDNIFEIGILERKEKFGFKLNESISMEILFPLLKNAGGC